MVTMKNPNECEIMPLERRVAECQLRKLIRRQKRRWSTSHPMGFVVGGFVATSVRCRMDLCIEGKTMQCNR